MRSIPKYVLLGLALLPASALAAETNEAPTTTIVGEVIDIGCYAAREARGDEHRACATRCLTQGNPAGVLLDDGQVFTIAAAAPAYKSLAAERVRVTGTVRGSLLRPTALAVWKDEAWSEIPVSKFGAPQIEEAAPGEQRTR